MDVESNISDFVYSDGEEQEIEDIEVLFIKDLS